MSPTGLVACGLTQILAEGSGCRWGGGGQLESMITFHGEALLMEVNFAIIIHSWHRGQYISYSIERPWGKGNLSAVNC